MTDCSKTMGPRLGGVNASRINHCSREATDESANTSLQPEALSTRSKTTTNPNKTFRQLLMLVFSNTSPKQKFVASLVIEAGILPS